jgi:hypothetical protein
LNRALVPGDTLIVGRSVVARYRPGSSVSIITRRTGRTVTIWTVVLFNVVVAIGTPLEFSLAAVDGTLKPRKTPLVGLCIVDRQPHL